MSNQLETVLLKKTPCNGCRERKRKCSYEQPCARCVKFKLDCIYTVMPSPKDIEYIKELEQMQEIEALQQQITNMENEMNVLKLARDNLTEVSSPATLPAPDTPSSVFETNETVYHDYPSPISLKNQKPLDLWNDRIKINDYLFSSRQRNEKLECVQHYMEPPRKGDSRQQYFQADSERAKAFRDLLIAFHPHGCTIAKSDNIQATVSKVKEENESKPWTLTVNNGNMTIETNIGSHSELMSQLSGMLATSIQQKNTSTVPFPLLDEVWAPKNAMGAVLTVLIWKKYAKSRFKSMTKYTPKLFPHYESAKQVTFVSTENIANITMRLVHAYFKCLHMKMIYIHIPTFLRLFMTNDQHVMKSPAVLSLCADICHQVCKHLPEIVPQESLSDYAAFYIEQARELISEQFDAYNLETLLTYTFITVYYMKARNETEADRYLCMAERVYNLLLPQYEFKDGKPSSDEAIMFSRVHRNIRHLRAIIYLHRMMAMHADKTRHIGHGGGGGPERYFKLVEYENDMYIHISETDSPREVQFIKMKRLLTQLRGAIKLGARCGGSEDFPTYIGVFGHHIEMAMRHWYRNIVPIEFQLSLPLFEESTPNIEFFTILENECHDSPVPLLITLDLYNEFLIMSKSYIPKYPCDPPLNNEDLLELYRHLEYNIPFSKEQSALVRDKCSHWIKLIEKLRFLKHARHYSFTPEELEESDEAYFTRFILALNPSRLTFDIPFIHTSIRTALNMVRMTQFLLSRDYSCYLDIRWLLNAWDVLLRAARFKYNQPGVPLDRIRANLLICLNIIRDYVNGVRGEAFREFVLELEQEFDDSFK